MTDNEFLLFDRLEKIKSVIGQYGEDNFSISFSGGKDSTVLSWLIDEALPGNRIPRVYADTGIELNMVRDFVYDLQKTDVRIVIIKPTIPIKPMLERDGYPFKSKEHSHYVNVYQNNGMSKTPQRYLEPAEKRTRYGCPKILRYQFAEDFNLKISPKCCDRLKKEPFKNWQKRNGKPYSIIGLMTAEGGVRRGAKCLAFSGDTLKAFQPLVPVTKEWEEWLIETKQIRICDIYKPPYNFERTGCKGCPFAIEIQKELDTLQKYFPNERKQCEIIWAPVYAEYRKLGYRLRKDDGQITMEDITNG